MSAGEYHLFQENKLEITLNRLCHQLIENHQQFENSVLIGIQPRGIGLSKRLHELLGKWLPGVRKPEG